MQRIADLFCTFAKIGAFTFGGGYAMISLLEYECVERKQWLSSDELMDITVVAESTPGPIAINCATYTGYKQSGMPGAVAATVGIVLPSILVILLVSLFFENLLSIPIIAHAFRGIRVAVAVLIGQAAVKMMRKMLKKTPNKPLSLAFAGAAFCVVIVLDLLGVAFSTIWLIIASGALGFFLWKRPQV